MKHQYFFLNKGATSVKYLQVLNRVVFNNGKKAGYKERAP